MSHRLVGCAALGAMQPCDSAPDSSHVCDLAAAEENTTHGHCSVVTSFSSGGGGR